MAITESLTGVSYAQQAWGATHVVLGSLYESYRDFVAYRYQYRESVGIGMPHRNLLVMERSYFKYMHLQRG